jgi:GNAT superfamily N-acetyltransferase
VSAALHLCAPEDMDRLLPMVAACLAEAGHGADPHALREALAPLLEGQPHGMAYLIGPHRAPVGHIIISFGYSVAAGGITATVDQFYIRPNVRGRGMGGEVLATLLPALAEHGVKSLEVRLPPDSRARGVFERAGLAPHEGYQPLSRLLGSGPTDLRPPAPDPRNIGRAGRAGKGGALFKRPARLR